MPRSGPSFTSAKCPPGAGLEYSCELPFGFIWTPCEVEGYFQPIHAGSTTTTATNTTGEYDDRTALPPILCLSCLSYLNLYAQINHDRWTCPLCGYTDNVLPPALVQPSPETDGETLAPILACPAIELRQEITGRLESTTTGIDVTNVIVVMDAHLPSAEAWAVGVAMQDIISGMLSANHTVNLGLIVFGTNLTIYHLVNENYVDDGGEDHDHDNFVVSAEVMSSHDGVLDLLEEQEEYPVPTRFLKLIRSTKEGGNDMESFQRCIQAQYGLKRDAQNGHLHDRANAHTGDTDIEGQFFGSKSPSSSSRLEMLRKRKEIRLRKQQQDSEDLPSQVDAELQPRQWQSYTGNHRSHTRCTGEAIQAAMDLASSSSTIYSDISFNASDPALSTPTSSPSTVRTARILLFTNGCPSKGDGSVVTRADSVESRNANPVAHVVDYLEMPRAKEFFDLLGKTAIESGVGVDVMCTGAAELGMPVYQALVEPSSGYAISHDTFLTSHLRHNLQYILQSTFLSGLYAPETSDMNWIDGCFVDLRLPSYIEPIRLVGTGEFVEDNDGLLPNERAAFAAGSAMAGKAGIRTTGLPLMEAIQCILTRIRLGRYDPLSTLSVMLKLNDVPVDEEYITVQCIVRFVDRFGTTLITRVTTSRLAIAKDVSTFLDSIDEEVVPVVLGKEAVYRSIYGREVDGTLETETTDPAQLERLAYEAQRDIDATVRNISASFRLLGLEEGTRELDLTEQGQTKAVGTSLNFAFPSELSDAVRRLYHLRRGPLVYPGPLQSMDDRAEKRSLFLRLPLEASLCMMAPSVWSSGSVKHEVIPDLSQPAPPETLALWDDCIIAADHYVNTFIWSGKSTLEEQHNVIRGQLHRLLQERAKDRFPMPILHIVSENDSMSRRFTSLLAPSHTDPVDYQIVHFPMLESLSSEELSRLGSKFRFHDPETDPSFRRWFWDVTSAAQIVDATGMSLCE